MRGTIRGKIRRSDRPGFLLLVALFSLTGLLALTAAGLGRSTTELLSAKRHVALDQAFQIAEAGIDMKLSQLGDANPANDQPAANGEIDGVGGYAVTEATPSLLQPDTWEFTSTGTVNTATLGSTSRSLHVAVQRVQGLPILAATTVVGELRPGMKPIGNPKPAGLKARFYKKNADGTLDLTAAFKVDGCDASAGTCLHGLAVTTNHAFEDFAKYVQRVSYETAAHIEDMEDEEPESDVGPEGWNFGDRVVGAPGDTAANFPVNGNDKDSKDLNGLATYLAGQRQFPNEYSIHVALQDPNNGGLGYDGLKDLAAFAKQRAQENGCYFSTANDDDSSSNTVKLKGRELRIPSTVTLGPPEPAICYVEVPLTPSTQGGDTGYLKPAGGTKVVFEGETVGEGLLVVQGAVEINPGGSNKFQYRGIIVEVGPASKMKIKGTAEIDGAVILATTDLTFDGGNVKWSTPKFEPQAPNGYIRYNRDAVAMAQSLLAGWKMLNGDTVGSALIKAWQNENN